MQIKEKIIKGGKKQKKTPTKQKTHKFQAVSVKLLVSEGTLYTHYHTYSIIPTSTKSTAIYKH